MTYEKPEVMALQSALDAVQAIGPKNAVPNDSANALTAPTGYEADE